MCKRKIGHPWPCTDPVCPWSFCGTPGLYDKDHRFSPWLASLCSVGECLCHLSSPGGAQSLLQVLPCWEASPPPAPGPVFLFHRGLRQVNPRSLGALTLPVSLQRKACCTGPATLVTQTCTTEHRRWAPRAAVDCQRCRPPCMDSSGPAQHQVQV